MVLHTNYYDMIMMASDINDTHTRNTVSLNVYLSKLNIEYYQTYIKDVSGKIWMVYLIMYKMHY